MKLASLTRLRASLYCTYAEAVAGTQFKTSINLTAPKPIQEVSLCSLISRWKHSYDKFVGLLRPAVSQDLAITARTTICNC